LRRHGGVRQKVYIDYGKKIEVDRQLVMRKLVLLDEYMSGMTLEQVAVKNNISRERVRQLITSIPQYHDYRKNFRIKNNTNCY